jgi:5-methylcytosine-specific restriction endonuclease McrA
MRVYLLGKEEDGPILEELAGHGSAVVVTKRPTMGSDWAKLTPYYLDIDTEVGARMVAPLLLYAASRVKSGKGSRIHLFPSEQNDREMSEGSRTTVEVSRIERDALARKKCIALFGTTCAVCGFNFEAAYGKIGEGFIHVHHLNPLAMAAAQRNVNPRTDLRPVCPNCHEMLHRQRPPFTIEELQAQLKHKSKPGP